MVRVGSSSGDRRASRNGPYSETRRERRAYPGKLRICMKWLSITGWTYLVFALHAGFAREMAIGACAPHLILAGLVLMVLRLNGRDGIALAAGWGFLSDCLVEGRLGADVVVFVLAAGVVRQLSVRWSLRVPWRAGAFSIGLVWGAVVASTAVRMLADGIL